MISPHTPPGTKVVTMNITRCVRPNGEISSPPIGNGVVLTVKKIHPHDSVVGFVATVEELPDNIGICLLCLRRLDLPKCLTDLLNVAPAPVHSELPRQHTQPVKALTGVSSRTWAGALASASFLFLLARSRTRAT